MKSNLLKLVTKKLFSVLSLFALLSVVSVSNLCNAAEVNAANYDIYYGDVNGDGISDIYFSGKPQIIILAGDIAIPIVYSYAPSFAIYGVQAGSYYNYSSTPVFKYLDATTLSSYIQNGTLRLAVAGTDFFFSTNSVAGLPTILIRGADVNYYSLLLASYATQNLPVVLQAYPANLATNLSDRNTLISFVDQNHDGLTDIVANGAYAFLSDQNGIPLATNLVNGLYFVPKDSYISVFDVAGRVTGTIAPDPDDGGNLKNQAVRNTYDPTTGLPIKVESGYLSVLPNNLEADPATWGGSFIVMSRSETVYDDKGRKIKSTNFDKTGNVLSLAEFTYDDYSRLRCTAIRMDLVAKGDACQSTNLSGTNPDRIERLTYDSDYGVVLYDERAVGTPLQETYVTNTYYPNSGILASQKDANGNLTSLYYNSTYDANNNQTPTANGLLKRIVYPSPTVKGQSNGDATSTTGDYVEYSYDANGNRAGERKRNGAYVSYTYDANNRKIRTAYSDKTKQKDICYDYDWRGLQTSALFITTYNSDNTCTGSGLTNSYDGFGRIATATNQLVAGGKTLSYQYDDNGNRVEITHADGQKFSYTFDGLNRVTGVSDYGIQDSRYTYFNKSYTTVSDDLLTVDYQDNGRRNSISRNNGYGGTTTYTFSNGVQLNNFQQNFPAANSANNLSNSFTFNAAGQIVTLTQSNTQYVYAGNNNLTGAYTPDGLNRYTSVNGVAMAYDTNSNLTNDGTQTYTYDDENRLLTTTKSTSPTVTSNLSYDPNGRLYLVNINNNGVTTSRQFLYDNNALVAEYDSSGNLLKRYVQGDQVDEPWVEYSGSSVATTNRLYFHEDHQSSIIALSDANGNVTAKFAYDAFGIPAAANNDTFGYTGQIYLKEIGLDYYKARIYSPKLGRFLQTDPIGYKDDMDLYSYVGNDPLNKTDPTGLFEFSNCTVTGTGQYNCGFSGSSSSSASSSKSSSSNNSSSNEASGSSSSTPSTQAASSAEPAQIAFYEHGTKADSTPYNATVAVYSNGYSMVQTGANTWPSWSSRNPGIQAGTYKGAWGLQAHKGRAGIVLNNNGRISTVGPNGNQNGHNYADGIHVHSGGVKDRGSEGCLTFCNLTANSVFNFLSAHTSSPDVLVTVKRDE